MHHFVKKVFSRSCWKANFSTSTQQPSPFFRLLPCSVPFSSGMNLRVLDCVRAPAAMTCLSDISFQPSFASVVAVEVFEPAKSHHPFMLNSAIKNEHAVLDILLRCKYDMHQMTHQGFAKACLTKKRTELIFQYSQSQEFFLCSPKDFPTDDRFPILPINGRQQLIYCHILPLFSRSSPKKKMVTVGLDGYGLRAGDILNVIMCIYIYKK